MRFTIFLAVAAALGVQAQEISRYFPPACGQSCGPIVIQQRNCRGNGDYRNCMCTWKHAKHEIPLCQACIKNGFPGNSNLGPLNALINECKLKTTTVNPNFAAATAAPMAAAAAIAGIAGYAAM